MNDLAKLRSRWESDDDGLSATEMNYAMTLAFAKIDQLQSDYATCEAERDALKSEVSLAKQDRDSWKSNWTILQDAANKEITRLKEELDSYKLGERGFP